MFEAELERARKRLKQQVASAQPYVSIVELLSNAQVHPAISAFFKAEVDWWVHEERALRTSNPRFATTDPVFADVFRRLDALYVQHARFDHEELTATIDAAAKTWLNYLCRPRVTLRWFVFRGEPTKPLHEILLRLQYLTEYGYLLEGFRQWAATRSSEASGFEILSVIEFERIIEKIDNDAILDMSQSQFVALLDPLFAFFATYDPDLPPESVPTEAVIIFLDDKGAVPISQALERMLYREEMRTLTRTKLIEVIDGVLASLDVEEQHASVSSELTTQSILQPVSGEVPQTPPHPVVAQTENLPTEPSEASLDKLASDVSHVVAADSVDHRAADADDVAMHVTPAAEPAAVAAQHVDVERHDDLHPVSGIATDEIATDEIATDETATDETATDEIATDEIATDEIATDEIATDETATDEIATDEIAIRETADEQGASGSELRRMERLTRLDQLIDERLRDRVVKRMFGRSREQYDDVVALVLACDSWKAAASALDRYYAQHGIEPNSAAAIEFSQAVYRSFSGITP